MSPRARRLSLTPEPRALARAIADEPGFVLLEGDRTRGVPAWLACRPRERSGALDPEPALAPRTDLGSLGEAPRWIGLLPYEARRVLERPAWTRAPDERAAPHVEACTWLRYGAVARVAEDVLVIGDDADAVSELSRLLAGPRRVAPVRVSRLPEEEPEAVHRARIARALELIVEGEIYQVNLARRFGFRTDARALELLERLSPAANLPHAAALELDGLTVAAASPELCLETTPRGLLVTCPIKGTRPRGADAVSDRALARALDEDPKEAAELAMVVDVERNDFGRVARTGSVRVPFPPRVETFGSVHHRVARVMARLRPGTSRAALLESVLPSGSVTGAPKVRAMEVIAELEAERRGLYTGAFGALSHDGSLRLGMAIRTLTVRGGEAHYFAGGGIVYGSDPDREVEETRWKARRVLGILGGS